ncbi:MAG: response regulator [candidate division Zixibacteria bacterium]|nr:response regulator [candidate division Zixibacteria bacterium]
MAIITMFGGEYCHLEEVADAVAARLHHKPTTAALIDQTSARYGIASDKLVRAMTGPAPLLGKFTRDRQMAVASLRVVLSELLGGENLLIAGHAGLLIPREILHSLRVCVIANFAYRVQIAMERGGLSQKDAEKAIHKDDKERLEWTTLLFDKSPYDETLYDIVIPMHDTSVSDAIDLVRKFAESDAVRTSERSMRAVKDFALSAAIQYALAEKGHDLEVHSESGLVYVVQNEYVSSVEQHRDKLAAIVKTVDGVKDVKFKVGPKYRVPASNPWANIDMPPRILLVDDEKEFVHTLSDRLQTRNLDSSVVYDGEQALEYVDREQPDVMVLDLMMPGIDGIEVLRRVKRDHPEVEVIILTGHGSDKEREAAMELGAFAYLNKPVGIDVLTQTMKEAYRRMGSSGSKTDSDTGE